MVATCGEHLEPCDVYRFEGRVGRQTGSSLATFLETKIRPFPRMNGVVGDAVSVASCRPGTGRDPQSRTGWAHTKMMLVHVLEQTLPSNPRQHRGKACANSSRHHHAHAAPTGAQSHPKCSVGTKPSRRVGPEQNTAGFRCCVSRRD